MEFYKLQSSATVRTILQFQKFKLFRLELFRTNSCYNSNEKVSKKQDSVERRNAMVYIYLYKSCFKLLYLKPKAELFNCNEW